MAQQWGWIMAIEREFQIGVQECENGLKNRIREFKMEFRNWEMGLKERERECTFGAHVRNKIPFSSASVGNLKLN